MPWAMLPGVCVCVTAQPRPSDSLVVTIRNGLVVGFPQEFNIKARASQSEARVLQSNVNLVPLLVYPVEMLVE